MTAPAATEARAVCASYIGARRMRVTKLDACGRPDKTSERGYAVSGGFVSVEIGTEVEEGEDYTQKTAGGELCVSDKGQDNIKWLTVSIEFCQVDPDIFQLLNPTWKLVQDAKGNATGFRIGQKMSDQYGFALELWPKVSGGGAGCDDEGGEEFSWPAEPSGYFLLPWTLGTAPDSWTLENGTATFTLQGRTKAGSRWGKGPWAVTRDADGKPSPLLIPIEDGLGSSGVPSIDGSYDPDHFHADQVTIPPPPARCGAYPITCPDMTATPKAGKVVSLTLNNWADIKDPATTKPKPVIVDWGDGSAAVEIPSTGDGKVNDHTYTDTTPKTITVISAANAAACTVRVTPSETVAETSDQPRRSMSLALDDAPEGDVLVDWGDGSSDTVQGSGPHHHEYAADGNYTIRALDESGREVTTQQVSVPFTTADPNDGR